MNALRQLLGFSPFRSHVAVGQTGATAARSASVSAVACRITLIVALTLSPLCASAAVRLYTIDCGALDIEDLAPFSDTGDYDGKAGHLVDPCFLVQHPKGYLLWDTGLGDALVGKPAVHNDKGVTLHVSTRLVESLREIGLEPADVTYVAFSHLHLDHTGNANLFTRSTWIINKKELDWALQTPSPFAVRVDSFSEYKNARTLYIDQDLDVFHDGLVRILATPGHTPGHQSLAVKLDHGGTILLCGDLFHLRSDRNESNFFGSKVMALNVSRADTIASFARVEAILERTRGRLVIQHDPRDIQALPPFPRYLD
jgi:glyoxylase-like metal-dependent hydrolase (beta-lactamase superfamily II)